MKRCRPVSLALVGPIDYQAQWASYVSAGWAQARTAPDCDVFLTPAGCDFHQWQPWLNIGDKVGAGGMMGPLIVGVSNVRPRRMADGILKAYYATHGPTYRHWIRVRCKMPDGREEAFIWKPGGVAKCSVLYPTPLP